MTDMQRYDVNDDGFQIADERGPFVLASDAEAAIAAAHHSAFAFGIKCAHKGRKRGEEDMLAKCIAAVEALGMLEHWESWIAADGRRSAGYVEVDVLAALRALQEKP